ncbi:GDP-mannose 4,6-dehydratase [Fusobacterium sp.]|uniref:GDP-mannose 4,6-dehydratase n=1 Tax=Fusobacterium sp. TaxID=68766 RepID=UPI00260ADF26|nr:GDP-mannose 4,6-dehydratase [Fusobacterium sp.]
MNIVVTGGAGFIGSHLCEELLTYGHRVINIDNFHEFYSVDIKVRNVLESTGNLKYISELENIKSKEEKIRKLCELTESENYKLYYTDIRDILDLEDIFSKENVNLVINLAGLAGVRPSLLEPISYEEVNIKGYMNLLEMCVKYNVKKFIQASSSSVYGNNKVVPFKETDIVDFAISPYAGTKKSCEVMGHIYHSLYNIDMFQLRFFTVYGERQRPDLAIYKFTKLILEDKEIPVYGDGNTFRDYTYVKDIVQGVIKSIDYLLENKNVYEILNIGESHTVSLKEMIEVIEKELNKKAIINHLPMQMGDVEKTYADISKAKNLIGYEPHTPFEEGMRKFIRWYKKGER